MPKHRLGLVPRLLAGLLGSLTLMTAAAQAAPDEVILLSKSAPKTSKAGEPAAKPASKGSDKHAEACKGWRCDEDFPFDLHLLFNLGYSRYGLTDLNKTLQAKGYSAFGENSLALGGSMQFSFWNVLTEFDTNFALTAPSLNDSYISSLTEGNFLLNLGYQFKPVRQLRIYPLLGIGLGFLDMSFRRRAILPSFDEFLTNPGRQGKISNLFLTLNAGLGIDWVSDWGVQIGLRGGYLWTPPSNWWQLQDISSNNDDNNRSLPVAGGPEISLSGPYVKVMMGF